MQIPTHFVPTTFLLILAALLFTLLTSLTQEDGSILKPTPSQIVWVVKTAFIMSLLPLFSITTSQPPASVYLFKWFYFDGFSLASSFSLDFYAITFNSVALFITWSILEFSLWYMASDPLIRKFMNCLVAFLVAMLLLTSSDNLFQLFLGWEAVGAMSFVLISWWHARASANTSALQAMIYNRVGDIGLLVVIIWSTLTISNLQLNDLMHWSEWQNMTFPALALVLAAAGKSAQFGLHPWLPAAMEGPTPVSALLHSSTMVVAGIFLLVRMGPVTGTTPLVLDVCLWLGALTTLFTATCALTQNDVKKIVAFSTSSQLGLMMVAIGLNQPQVAFLHICTHAFFKAMLFLSSGSLIHSLNDEQDIRKMGAMFHMTPVTAACISVGSLALTGFPFLAGFYSKDLIIEVLNSSFLNSCALVMTLIATAFTAAYSIRLVHIVSLNHTRMAPLSPVDETPKEVINALYRLAFGSIAAGLIIVSNITPNQTPVMVMTPLMKMAALILTVLGFIIAGQIANHARKQFPPTPKTWAYKFSIMLGYFPDLMHRLASKIGLDLAHKIAAQMLDLAWAEIFGPKGLSSLISKMTSNFTDMQKGMIKSYMIFFILTIISVLISICI